jgi:REP element-mobilizing transposase RayT
MRQTSFLKELGYKSDATHGGKSSKGKRKIRRPLDPKYPVHLILKATKARNQLSMLRPRSRRYIWLLVRDKADQFNVKLAGFANVGNHLHLKIKFKRREDFQKYLKSVSSLIARHITGARKGRPFGKFWDHLAYTKVIKVWVQEKLLNHYIIANGIEADHGRKWREKYLEKHKSKPNSS